MAPSLTAVGGLALLLACLAGHARASAPGQVAPVQVAPGQGPPVYGVTRLVAGESVRVDGRLDESLWERAERLSPLTLTEPVQGAAPSHPTDVRLAFDADFLYVAIRCYDDPSQVRARQMDRDAFVRFDDVVEFWLDTFHDSRFAFWFQMTAGGSRGDALIAGSGTSFNKDFDTIWYGESRLTDEGWQAEIAIPFKSLAFRTDGGPWGFNLVRKRVSNGENARWASPLVAYSFFRLSEGGTLTGLEGLRQGLGLDVSPYVKGTLRREESGDEDALGDGGLDLRWRTTPASNLRVTVNTDFAETEVDERQVNLDRFPLFFPEKRDFFLEDAGVFEFGAPDRGRRLIPFFSRRIGRDDDGGEVPLLFGTKFTGRIGEWNVGLLDTLVGDSPTEGGPEGRNLFAARVSRNLGDESAVGAIFTQGNPGESRDNWVGGLDLRLSSSRALGDGRSGSLWLYGLRSGTEGDGGEGAAYGVQASIGTNAWSHDVATHTVESGFEPALGFVQRRGVRSFSWETEYTWRSQGRVPSLREVQVEVSPSLTRGLDGETQSWDLPLKWFELELANEDSVAIESRRLFENVSESFDLGNDVTVQPGEFTMTRHEVSFETNDRRDWGAGAEVEVGDFFSGHIFRWGVESTLIPNRFLQLRAGLESFAADLDEGDFRAKVASLAADASFSPNLSWKNLAQYDTESLELGFQSRLRWILTPGQELFLVTLLGWRRPDEHAHLAPTDQELALKLVYTLRF